MPFHVGRWQQGAQSSAALNKPTCDTKLACKASRAAQRSLVSGNKLSCVYVCDCSITDCQCRSEFADRELKGLESGWCHTSKCRLKQRCSRRFDQSAHLDTGPIGCRSVNWLCCRLRLFCCLCLFEVSAGPIQRLRHSILSRRPCEVHESTSQPDERGNKLIN